MSASSYSKKLLYGVCLTIWVVFSLLVGQTVAGLILYSLTVSSNLVAQTAVEAALGYVFALLIAIGGLALVRKKQIDKSAIGLGRLPSWSDIGLGILSVLPYYLLAAAVVWVGVSVLQVIDPTVGQEIAFKNVSTRLDYMLVFITFVVVAPFAEELLFRGYFLGKLSDYWGKWLAVIATAIIFGLLHLPGFTEDGVVWQWGAAADTFTMGLVAGILRQLSGSIWAGVLLHSIKNAVAFYFLFINPLPPGGM